MSNPAPKSAKDPALHPMQWTNRVAQALQDTANTLGRTVTGLKLPRFEHRHHEPSGKAGIDVEQLRNMPNGPGQVYVSCMDYCPKQVCATDIPDLDVFLKQHRPSWSKVRWINVDGLSDMKVLGALAEKYDLHPLAIEDMLQPGTRPKVESYPGSGSHHARLFIVARMIFLKEGHLHCEQICCFLGHNTLITFQQTHGDIWDPVRSRISKEGSRLRQNDVSFLLYALLDAVVDQCFPVLEHYSDLLDDVEAEVLQKPTRAVLNQVHHIKHELLLLRREFRPMRELIYSLQRGEHANFSEITCVFMRDVYDHSVQIIDLMETYREVAIGLTETYMNAMSQKLNEVMKVLTTIATIFMPLSFIAGIFGMNFEHMPELHSWWGYPYGFWLLCTVSVTVMLIWFKRNRWL